MSIYSSRFKSVEIITKKKPAPSASRVQVDIIETSYDVKGARDHSLELGIADLLAPKALAGAFFFTLLTFGFIILLAYGLLALAGKISFSREQYTSVELAFISVSCILFVAAWGVFTIRSAIRKSQLVLVEKERGKKNWKLIDEKNWERFQRMLKIKEKTK